MEHIHEGSQCGGYSCANCEQSSAEPFDCPCGAGRADHVLLIEDEASADEGTVVVTTANCEVILDAHGFYARCTRCPWVSEYTPAKHRARQFAAGHEDA